MPSNGLRLCAVNKVSFNGILDHRPGFPPPITSRDHAFRQAHGGGACIGNNELY